MYRSWHSDPSQRPSLSLIKNILRLTSNALPKKKQLYTDEKINELKNQWLHKYLLPEKYLPHEPRMNNEQSMNIYQEHLTIIERVMKIQKEVSELKQKIDKNEHYKQLLNENENLQRQIDEVRSRTDCWKGK